MEKDGNCLVLQKNLSLHFVDGVTTSGNDPTYYGYPTLPMPNMKSEFQLCGNFWNFKYYFETQSLQQGTKIESDACQMYLHFFKSNDNSDIEFQFFCDAGPKANLGGWQLTKMKWMTAKVSFVNPENKQIIYKKKTEGETRCGKLHCPCGQTKLCLRKQNFISPDLLHPLYILNKCSKARNGMSASFYCTVDVIATITLFPHNPKFAQIPSATNILNDLFWKSHHEASKRIFHAKIGTDFKLEVNGKEFPCHKCILAGHSEVFNRMFANDSNNRRQASLFPSTLVMEGMSVMGVDYFLKYLYYGDTSFSQLSASLAYELMRAAEKYHIPHLRRASYEILDSKPLDDFDCKTALKIYLHPSSPTSTASLKQKALQCFTKNYSELVKSEEFVKLFEEKRECAQEILIKVHKNK